MTTTTLKPLTYSKVDTCPNCQRKLCKRVNRDGVMLVHFKHKVAEAYAVDLNIKCIGCGRFYFVNAVNGVIDEDIRGRT